MQARGIALAYLMLCLPGCSEDPTSDLRDGAASASDGGTLDSGEPELDAGSSAPDAERDAQGDTDGPVDPDGGACQHAKPGPDNTGVPRGTQLKPSKSLKITSDSAIVENLDIDGTITVLANNVTIRRVRIRSGDYYPIRYFDNDNTGLLVEDSEIIGTSGDVTSAIAFANYTARRLNIHGSADGLKADQNVLIEDCWIHDLSNGQDEHNDAVQSTGGKGVTVRHNVLEGASNACVQTGDEGAATENLTIECNWLSGGGYSLNIRGEGATRPKNTRIIDNIFSKDAAYGAITIDDPSPVVTGNAYSDGTPISL